MRRAASKKLMDGMTFASLDSVVPGKDVMRLIVEAGGI